MTTEHLNWVLRAQLLPALPFSTFVLFFPCSSSSRRDKFQVMSGPTGWRQELLDFMSALSGEDQEVSPLPKLCDLMLRTPLIRCPNIVARVVRLRSSIPIADSDGFCRTNSVELRPSMCSFAPSTCLRRAAGLRRIAHLRAKLQCLAHACLWRAVGLRRGSPLR